MIVKNDIFPYKDIRESINKIQPGLFDEIQCIAELPLDIGVEALAELLAWACTPSFIPSIIYAREQIQKIDSEWLTEYLPEVALRCLNLNDEWEYRRLLEVIEHIPKLLYWAVALGKQSENPEIIEASYDFAGKINL